MAGSSQKRAGAAVRAGAGALACLLACCILVASWASLGDAAAPGLAQPDYNVYLKKDDLLKKVQELAEAHPDTMKLETRSAKDGNYSADLMVITVEPGGISTAHNNKARLFFDFGEHGREFISSEVGLRLLQVLQDDAALERLLSSSRRMARLKAILKHTVIKVVPMENVHGRELVELGKLCERKNGRGVDTNRNWDIDWGKKEKDYDPNEEYPGRAPHSEPEVQILLGLAKELQPHVWLNVHSGMYALFTPYDHKPSVPDTPNARAALRMMSRVQELSCPKCVVGSGGHSVGYLAHGTGTDYMYEVLGVPMSFTWEIYGDNNATFEDCFKMFNPLGKEHFEQVVTLWTKALLQLLELLPSHPATWPLYKAAGLDRSDQDAAVAGKPDSGAGAGAGAADAADAAGAAGTGSSAEPQKQAGDAASDGATAAPAAAGKADDDAVKGSAAGAAADDDKNGNGLPDEEGSLWQKKQPTEEEPTFAQGQATASPAAAAAAAAAAASPPPAPAPAPAPAVTAATVTSAASAAAADTTTKPVDTQQKQQQQQQQQMEPEPDLLLQQQQQQAQGRSSALSSDIQQDVQIKRIPIGGSGSAGLIRHDRTLPLLVGIGGLAALAYFLTRRSKQPPGPQYKQVIMRTRTL